MNGDLVASKIYIGAPIDQESERKFLASTIAHLGELHIPFVVLANFHVGGRQIDCVVATAHSVSVVEIKSSYLPVRGEINGVWARLHLSGDWQPYTNAYQQALAAKNTLRDAMMATRPVGDFYPDGHVVFTSGLPEGSQVTAGDFKVTVTTLDRFLSNSKVRGTAPWSLNDWRALATKLTLMPISPDEAIGSPKHQEAANLLLHYNSALVAEYGRDGSRWLSEDTEQRSKLIAMTTTGTGCFISGPSGCGKTLMAKWVAAKMASAGTLVFYFAAKDFVGSWADAIRREVALICDLPPSALLRAISLADRPVILVLDGINELGARRRDALRGIRALARRLGAKLIATGQERKPSEFDGLSSFTVNRPSIDLKRHIAQSGGARLSAIALEVLKAIGSGMEAEIVGQIGGHLKEDASRLVLVDQYIRMRLGGRARAGSLGLRRLASSFHEHVAFSMSETSFDELMRTQELSFEDCDALFAARLLVRRAGRVSFSHEMLQNVCAAFDLARKAAADPITFGHRFSTPLLDPISGDVVSAIEDPSTCRAILEQVTSPILLSAAANGGLDAIAASIAGALLDETAEACRVEIQSARLVVTESDAVQLEWAEDSRRDWNAVEEARLQAIGRCAASERGLDRYLALCAAMDERLMSERRRLATVAREMKFPLRSRSFALAYYGFGNQIGFTHVARAVQASLHESHRGVEQQEFSLAEMGSGQLHFFLENRRAFFGHGDEGRLAEELVYLLNERFRWEPYHVQLAILAAVGFARQAPPATLERLVNAINALDVAQTNFAINSAIIDALKILGAITDESGEARSQIKHELASVLGDSDDGVDKDLALSLCHRMFDHPFDSIYAEEIFQLDDALRHRLFRRALGASDIKGMIFTWLGRQVAAFEDAADVSIFQPLATLPDASGPFPQEEWGGFVLATRFLARLGAELPQVSEGTAADRCLIELRTLIYAAESQRQADLQEATLAWQRLQGMSVQLVVGCMSEVHIALTDWHWTETDQTYPSLNLTETYLADCLRVARRFVDEGKEAEYFRPFHSESGPSLAFGIVGHHGDRSDIHRLRRLARAHPFARHALAALKALDGVSTPPS